MQVVQLEFESYDCYSKSGLSGALPSFQAPMFLQVWVKVREVLEWDLPELTLEICKEVSGQEVESIDKFYKMVKEAVLREASGELQVSFPGLKSWRCPLYRLHAVCTGNDLASLQKM
jgi:hypothetical protein